MKIAFIGGSGLAQELNNVLDSVEHKTNVKNKWGTVLSYYEGKKGNVTVIILPRHGDSQETPARSPAELVQEKGYEAHIWLLHKLGVQAIFGLTAVGSLDDTPLADTGTFVVPQEYIRGLAASQHSFGKDAEEIHTNMNHSFDPELNKKIIGAAHKLGFTTLQGTYIYNGGDTFETGAEIRLLGKLTNEEPNRVVGLTTVPELILAKQMNIPFAAIASVVNGAEGLSQETVVSHEQTLSVMEKAGRLVQKLVKEIIESYE